MEPSTTVEPGSRPPRVLIAEDTPHSAELLEVYLEKTPCEVRIASDGEETLQVVQAWQPDVILLDIMMPRISGFEVCKRLRANPQTRHIAVLMITALDQSSDIDRAVEVGCDDFLSKPIQKADLLNRLSALLESRRQSSDLDRTLAYIQAVEHGEHREIRK